MQRSGTRRRLRARLREIVLAAALAGLPLAVGALPVPHDGAPDGASTASAAPLRLALASGSEGIRTATLGFARPVPSLPAEGSLGSTLVSEPTANVLLALGLAGLTVAGSRHRRRHG